MLYQKKDRHFLQTLKYAGILFSLISWLVVSKGLFVVSDTSGLALYSYIVKLLNRNPRINKADSQKLKLC